jgi:hypothetical protein
MHAARLLVSLEDELMVRDVSTRQLIAHYPCDRAAAHPDDVHVALWMDDELSVIDVREPNVPPPQPARAVMGKAESATLSAPEQALAGLRVVALGNVIHPEKGAFLSAEQVARLLEAQGATMCAAGDGTFELAVIGLTAIQHQENFARVLTQGTPLLNAATLLERAPRPDLVDALGALLRFAQQKGARSGVDRKTTSPGTWRDSLVRYQEFGWKNHVRFLLYQPFPQLDQNLASLLECLSFYSVRWQQNIGNVEVTGGIELNPRIPDPGSGPLTNFEYAAVDECPHAVLDNLNDASSAVFQGNYEGPEVYCWSKRDPGSLTLLAPNVFAYCLLAVENEGRPLWQLARVRPDLLTDEERKSFK